jgi:PAS domain S-box-containing protein
VTDPDKSVSFYNKTALNFAGCTMQQLIGNGWTELVHRQDLDGVNSTYLRAVEARRSFRIECRMRRVDGKYRWVLNTGTPRFVDSVYVGHIGTVVDITDIKRSHERMLASQKLESLGVLAAGMAHDFNNMLGAIFAESDLAQAEIPPDSPAIDNVKRISAVANRASEIVNLLMAYAGGRDTVIEMVDLSRIVEEMLELLRISILKNAVLQTSLPRDLPPVQANAAQLRQVVLNLIMNAWEALRDGEGRIVVSTEHIYFQPSAGRSAVAEGHYIRLMVSDTGCGMTEEVQARVFDPYFTTKFLGRGLGLAAVQGILRSHGAAINVLSTPGVGSTFEVLLPCAQGPRHETLQYSRPEVPDNGLPASGTILLVEDEDTLRMATSSGLQKAGFSVLAVGDGRAAVNLFRARARDIDAVLLDVTLPGISGLQVLKEIRQVKADVKVILTSAYDSERVNSRAAHAGHSPHGFIRKPYRFFDLMRTLQDTLNERHSSVLGKLS